MLLVNCFSFLLTLFIGKSYKYLVYVDNVVQNTQMSFSYESTTNRHKRTATERADNNGDPLVVKKKAREAAKAPAPAVSTGQLSKMNPAIENKS